MSLVSLNKISILTSNIAKIKWFSKVGKDIDPYISPYIKNYCHKLNIETEIKQVRTWEEAIKVINRKDWNKICWEIEENEKTALLNILLESENEKEIFSYLNSLTEETSKITEIYSIKGLNKNNIKYQYYSKVAAGAAALCCYQTALALASNQKPNHIFISKYELFKSGHWPLIITKNYFNIF